MAGEALLWSGTLAWSVGCALVLLLRRPLRRWLGAQAAYRLWGLPLIALGGVMLPAPSVAPVAMQALPAWAVADLAPALPVAQATAVPAWLVPAWLLGALASLAWQWRAQWRFVRGLGPLRREARGRLEVRRAAVAAGLPALVGVWRPRIVLPADFEQRYTPVQRVLLLRHELVHLRRGDAWANALASLLRAAQWFNPLAVFAYARFRVDQELACDARVLAGRGVHRRRYAHAMLQAHLPGPHMTAWSCPWPSGRLLKERIQMLNAPLLSRRRRLAAVGLLAVLAASTGYVAWAAQPAQASRNAAVAWYRTDVAVDVDGQARHFALIEQAGQWQSFTSGGDGQAWALQLRWLPADRGRLQLQTQLRHAGRPVATPEVWVTLDAPATLTARSEDGRSRFSAQLRASPAITPRPDVRNDPQTARLAAPAYPRAALDQAVDGEVVLLVDVRADGTVSRVEVERSRPQGLFDATAVEAARQWYFQPAPGQTGSSRLRVPVRFEASSRAPRAKRA